MQKIVLIRNLTRQGLEIILKSGNSYTNKWISKGEKFKAPLNSVTSSLRELQKRGMIHIQEVR